MVRTLRFTAALAAVALQMVVLYVPRTPSIAPATDLPLDKAVHLAVFALPTAALIRAGAPRRTVIAVMVLHAPVSELIQSFVLPARSGDARDLVADLVGIAIGALAAPPPAKSNGGAARNPPGGDGDQHRP